MSAKETVIAEIYRQVRAPEWATPNLDGLADVLRDLSWLPDGPVPVDMPGPADLAELTDGEREMLLHVLARAMADSAESSHPVTVREAGR